MPQTFTPRCLVLFLLLARLAFPAGCFAQELDPANWVTDGKVNTVVKKGNRLYVGGAFTYLGPNTGYAVPLEKGTSKPVKKFPAVDGPVNACVPDGRGGWYLGGNFRHVGGTARRNLVHLDPSLNVTGWDPNPEEEVYTLAVHGTSVFVGGTVLKVKGQTRNGLAEIDARTGACTAFDLNIPAAEPNRMNPYVKTLLVSGNKLYLGGFFSVVSGQSRVAVACIDLATRTLTPWNPQLTESTNSLQVTRIVKTGHSIVFAGHFYKVRGATRVNVAEVDTTAGAPTGFQVDYNPSYVSIKALAVDGNRLFLGGSFGAEAPLRSLIAVDLNTSRELPWPQSPGSVSVLTIIDSTLYVGGSKLRAFHLRTGLATGDSTSLPPSRQVLTIAGNGASVYVGGTFTSLGGAERHYLAALDAATGAVLPWNARIFEGYPYVRTDLGVKSIAFHDRYLFIGGTFGYVGFGKKRYLAAQIDTTTALATDWDAKLAGDYCCEGSGEVNFIHVSNNQVYLIGNYMSINNESTDRRGLTTGAASFDLVHGNVTNWKPATGGGWDLSIFRNSILSVLNRGDTLFLAGTFQTVAGQPRNGMAAVDATTGELLGWNPGMGAGSRVNVIKYDGGRIAMAGNFTLNNAPARHGFGWVSPVDGQASPAAVAFNGTVKDFAIHRDTLYACGDFTRVNDLGRNQLASVYLPGGAVTDWNPNLPPLQPLAPVSVSIHGPKLYLAGKFEYMGDRYLPYLATWRLQPRRYNKIRGQIFADPNANCTREASEPGLDNYIVKAEPGPYYASADPQGNFTLSVDAGEFTVSQVLPRHKGLLVGQTCPVAEGTYAVRFASDDGEKDGIIFANAVAAHPFLSVEVAADRRRRCFRSLTTVSYRNEGYAAAANVRVKVVYPPYVVPIGSSQPWQRRQGDTLFFELGTLAPGVSRTILITDSTVCGNEAIRGLTQCVKAYITPRNNAAPADPRWDQATAALFARCKANGLVRLTIRNAGSGHMADSAGYRVYLDAVRVFAARYKLRAGDSLALEVPANGRTVRLEADQTPFSPGVPLSSITLEGCGGSNPALVSKGFVDQLPQDDAGEETATACLPILDSFDPNDKIASPAGVTEARLIRESDPLQYTIRFQNTGTDVAYKVVIEDELSEHLDLATLRIGAASHPFTWKASGQGKPVITWTFNNINLPDSTSNEPASHGFVSFRIAQRPGNPLGTRIANQALITFDYNSPIATNQTLHTVGRLPQSTAQGAVNTCGTDFPDRAGAGADIRVCEAPAAVLAAVAPRKGVGRWRVVQGQGTLDHPDSPAATLTQPGYGKTVLEWSVSLCDSVTRDSVTVERFPLPSPPVVMGNLAYCAGEPVQLRASGENVAWYADARGDKLLFAGSTFAGPLPESTTLYVNQRADGCAGPMRAVPVTIHPPAAPPGVTGKRVYCAGEPLQPLTATGSNVQWYADAGLRTLLSEGNAYRPTVTASAPLYVVQSAHGCVSPATEVWVVVHPVPPAPSVPAPAPVCAGDVLPVLEAAGENITWYADAGLTQHLARGTTYQPRVTSGTTFYATQTVNGCPGPATAVALLIKPRPAAPLAPSPQRLYCAGEEIATLSATGENIEWYRDAGLTDLLHRGRSYAPLLSATGTFYVTQTVEGCRSDAVPVTVRMQPAAFEAGAAGDTLTAPPSERYQWYFEGKPIAGATGPSHRARSTGSYHVVTGNESCSSQSVPRFIRIDVKKPVLTLSPNPAGQRVHLDFTANDTGTAQVSLYDAKGRQLQRFSIDKPYTTLEHRLEVAPLPGGVYWLEVRSGNSRAAAKWIKL
jgi:hypothetical protein